MNALLPDNTEYIVAGLLFLAYLVLRLNLMPRVKGRQYAEILLLCLFCGVVLLNLHAHRRAIVSGIGWIDQVSPTESVLRELDRAIPQGTRVAYLSDVKASDAGASLGRYFLTQYALAPRIVERGGAQDWAVVNDPAHDHSPAPPGMTLVRDFGGGLLLFRRGGL